MNKPNPNEHTAEQLATLDQPIRLLVDAHAALADAEKADASEQERADLTLKREDAVRLVLNAATSIGINLDSGVLASVVGTAASLAKAAGKGERTPYAVVANGKFLHECNTFHESRRFR
jgi:hypothetical protein